MCGVVTRCDARGAVVGDSDRADLDLDLSLECFRVDHLGQFCARHAPYDAVDVEQEREHLVWRRTNLERVLDLHLSTPLGFRNILGLEAYGFRWRGTFLPLACGSVSCLAAARVAASSFARPAWTHAFTRLSG